MLPTLAEIEALHRKYAPTQEAFDSVYTHCCIVADIADQLMTRPIPGVNRDAVRAGCLLHDIGVYQLYAEGVYESDQYIRHGVLGEAILRNEGFSEHLCRFCSHHTGVGITKDEIVTRNLPLPHEDFLAETEEEWVVMYADKFHSKSEPPRFNAPETYAARVSKFGVAHETTFRSLMTRYGLPNLAALSDTYGHPVI